MVILDLIGEIDVGAEFWLHSAFKIKCKSSFQGIIARDLDHDDSSVTITAGGVGSSFVNLRFKSERGSGLNYQVEIYA